MGTGVDTNRILRFSLDPDPESFFNFDSSRSLCGHFLSKNMGKLRLDQ